MRRIALDPDTITVLTEHRNRARHRATLLDEAGIDDWYLFSNDPAHAAPLNPDWVTHRYTDMAAELGIATHLHALRHYSATELLSAGVDLATVSGRLGHGGGAPPPYVSTRPGLPRPTGGQPTYLLPRCQSDAWGRAIRHDWRAGEQRNPPASVRGSPTPPPPRSCPKVLLVLAAALSEAWQQIRRHGPGSADHMRRDLLSSLMVLVNPSMTPDATQTGELVEGRDLTPDVTVAQVTTCVPGLASASSTARNLARCSVAMSRCYVAR
jgi:Phage integrase family